MYNLIGRWRVIPNDGLIPGTHAFDVSYQFLHVSGECPDVHTYRDNFHAVVAIKCGTLEFTLMAGPNWLCIEGQPVLLATREGEPFDRLFDSDLEKLFGAVLANYMSLSDPELDEDFAGERCGVEFADGLPIRGMSIGDTRH